MAKRAVFGITATKAQADNIVAELHSNGIAARDISVLFADEAKKQAMKLDDDTGNPDPIVAGTHAPEGAAIGASAGTAIGGALGLLTGIGALIIPGLGLFIAAGPLLATLGGLGVGAAVGGVSGSLIGLGIPERHARRYEDLVKSGATLIAVHFNDRAELRTASEVLARRGATDIMTSYETPDVANAVTPAPYPASRR